MISQRGNKNELSIRMILNYCKLKENKNINTLRFKVRKETRRYARNEDENFHRKHRMLCHCICIFFDAMFFLLFVVVVAFVLCSLFVARIQRNHNPWDTKHIKWKKSILENLIHTYGENKFSVTDFIFGAEYGWNVFALLRVET